MAVGKREGRKVITKKERNKKELRSQNGITTAVIIWCQRGMPFFTASRIGEPVLLEQYVVLENYQKRYKNDISLKKGYSVDVIEKHESGKHTVLLLVFYSKGLCFGWLSYRGLSSLNWKFSLNFSVFLDVLDAKPSLIFCLSLAFFLFDRLFLKIFFYASSKMTSFMVTGPH